MASVTTPLVNPFKSYTSSVLRTSFFPSYNFKTHFPFIRLSISSTWVSHKSKNSPYRVVPLVAQTSDWAQQDEEEVSGKDGLAWEGAEDIEGDGDGTASFEGESENEENFDGGGSYSELPEEARLYVGNLPYNVDSEQLAQLFDQAGVVEIAEVIYNRETDRSRGFGFVTMSTVEEAEKAVEMFNRYDMNGRLLTVNKAGPKGSRPERPPGPLEPSFKAFVVNLPWQVDDARLERVFSQHGNVVEAKVIYERESLRSRGFGFVTMSTESELNQAVAALDGQDLDGRTIRVSVAEEKPRRSFF